MMLAKFIFTIAVDDDGQRTIQCDMPAHNLETIWWLVELKTESYAIKEFCQDMYDDCNRMLLELQDQWDAKTAEEINDSSSQQTQ